MPVRPTRPFLVPAARLRKVVGTVRHEQRRGAIEGLGTVSVVVPEGGEVAVDVTLSSYPEGIMAQGTVTAPWVGECRRCGGPVAGQLAVDVRERYAPAGSADDEAYPLADDVVDLEPLARDAVLLDLPLAPLCSEGCLGLCPQCGVNRNVEECRCQALRDPRWAGLDVLRDEGGGGVA